MNYRELTINEICKIEGFHEEIVVEKSVPLSGWFAGIMDDKLKDLPDGSIARLVRQNFHLKYVIPEAILRLSKNPIAGEHYEGELINSINAIESDFWKSNLNLCKELKELLEKIETKEVNLPQDFEWFMEEEEQEFYESVRKVISILMKC
nr:contact-dependent growth inhibition system immunity protein [Paenibacillus monticola]